MRKARDKRLGRLLALPLLSIPTSFSLSAPGLFFLRPGCVGRVFDLTKPRRRVLDVRAVGGGSRGRPELGPCRLQCGGEGEGLRAFRWVLDSLRRETVKACLSRGKFGSFGVSRALLFVFGSSWYGWLCLRFCSGGPGFWLVLRSDCGRGARLSLPVCVSAFR